jgi:NF-X1-type zinc finger protein NFXL1
VAPQEGLERVKEHLLAGASEAAVCLVCLENIQPTDPVWSCQDGCYAVMHLTCVQVNVTQAASALGRLALQAALACKALLCAAGAPALPSHPCVSECALQSWARRTLVTAQEKAAQRPDPRVFPEASAQASTAASWGCPKCR